MTCRLRKRYPPNSHAVPQKQDALFHLGRGHLISTIDPGSQVVWLTVRRLKTSARPVRARNPTTRIGIRYGWSGADEEATGAATGSAAGADTGSLAGATTSGAFSGALTR